ncbi:MAG: hypothetical protein WAV90_01020 [Gordonia amarae]
MAFGHGQGTAVVTGASYLSTAAAVPADEPAGTLVWLATAADTAFPGGRYFHCEAPEQPSAAACDDAAAARLWTESEAILAGLGYPATRGA